MLITLNPYSSEAQQCIGFPGRRMIIKSQSIKTKVCGTDGINTQCQDFFDGDTVKTVGIFQKELSVNKYLYVAAGGTQLEVTSNCGQLGVEQSVSVDFERPGFETATFTTTLSCGGSIRRNRRFKVGCSGTTNQVCYSDGACFTRYIQSTVEGQFRK